MLDGSALAQPEAMQSLLLRQARRWYGRQL
jgi:hypothetical protein